MLEIQDNIERLIEQSITFDYIESDVNEYIPHYSYWRLLPFCVIVCPTVGECTYELQTGGEKKIRPGEMLLVPPNLNHKFEMTNGRVDYIHLHFKIFDHIDLLSLFTIPNILIGAESEKIRSLVREQHLFHHPKKENTINIKEIVKMKSQILQLLTIILDESKVNHESLNFIINFQKISPVIKYINEHLNEPITREDMAKVISLSSTRFHYVFTEIMKISPVAYLKKLRLEKAQQLLVSTDMPVTEITEMVGFRDIFHFSKQFKKTFGLSPTKYKDSLKFSLFNVE